MLSSREYHNLIVGNIACDRDERQALWDVIRTQVSLGHPRSVLYLRLALWHGNNRALLQLLDFGWAANGPWWSLFHSPLRLATRLEVYNSWIQLHYDTAWKEPRWSKLGTHSTVFQLYLEKQKQVYENLGGRARMNKLALQQHGGRISPFVKFFFSVRGQVLFWWLHAIVYFIILPLAIVYGTESQWTTMSRAQKFGFAYLWSLLCCSINPVFASLEYMFYNRCLSPDLAKRWWLYSAWIFHVLFFHLVPPILIVGINWQPFFSCKPVTVDGQVSISCTDYSYLLPIAVPAIEAGAILAALILLFAFLFLIVGFMEAFNICYFTFSVVLLKQFRTGPFVD
jgi:hypothetical protein